MMKIMIKMMRKMKMKCPRKKDQRLKNLREKDSQPSKRNWLKGSLLKNTKISCGNNMKRSSQLKVIPLIT